MPVFTVQSSGGLLLAAYLARHLYRPGLDFTDSYRSFGPRLPETGGSARNPGRPPAVRGQQLDSVWLPDAFTPVAVTGVRNVNYDPSSGSLITSHSTSDGLTYSVDSYQYLSTLDVATGTTGNPKGALQAHRSMLGHMPGAEMGFDQFPQPGDCMWSPADWAWLAGLMDVLMPAWFHGVPVLTFRAPRFDPEQAYAMMGRHRVRTTLLTPTMLRVMRQIPDPVKRYGLDLRTIISGGESVGKELHEWSTGALGVPINEMFGQTECNLVLASNGNMMPVKPGSLGRAAPVMSPESSTMPANRCRPAPSATSPSAVPIR